MEYQDFTIDLRSAENGCFEATVATAPIREAPRIFFPKPIPEETIERLHDCFDRPGALAGPSTPELEPRRLGEQLYSALFQGSMADLFLRCRTALLHDERSGLRLRLRFRTDDTETDYLASLPWEWLWDPRSEAFLSTDLCTPVIRDLEASQLRGTIQIPMPLRILVVDAAPETMRQLNLKLETQRMAKALQSLRKKGLVELLKLPKATPEKLREVLRDTEIHVLHFMGHGGYHPESGTGAIFFTKKDGTPDQLDGLMLAEFLKRVPSLRLVVLNACKTARHGDRAAGAPLYYGAAAAILKRTGVPAVVANQYSISDDTAIAFSETFYRCLAAGDGIDTALTEARLLLNHRTPEWATPVLFLTAPDGRLFAPNPSKPEGTITSPLRTAIPKPAADPVRLGVRSIDGWGRDMKQRTDDVLELGELFEERFIKHREHWQEQVFPRLRNFLSERVDERRPLLLDFAAHSSIAFAAGWLLEPKSGLDVRVRQRIPGGGELDWHPTDGKEPEGPLWIDRPDLELAPHAPDIAVALSVSQPDVAEQVHDFVVREGLPVGRIVDAVISPEPGGRSVQGGAHSLRLAQTLLPRVQRKRPHERGGRVHFFCAAPNALVFYLGQLASALPGLVLYEYAFKAQNSFGRYQKSIELPPPGEGTKVLENF